MGTRNNPAPNDCYDRAEDDEPRFTFIARDQLSGAMVMVWALLRVHLADPTDLEEQTKIAEAMACAERMQAWRLQHRPDKPLLGGKVMTYEGNDGSFTVEVTVPARRTER